MSDPVITRRLSEAVSQARGFSRLYRDHTDPEALAMSIADLTMATYPLSVELHRPQWSTETKPRAVRWVGKEVVGNDYVLARFEYVLRDALKASKPAPGISIAPSRRGRGVQLDTTGLDIEATVTSVVSALHLQWETTYRPADNAAVEQLVTPWQRYADLPKEVQEELFEHLYTAR